MFQNINVGNYYSYYCRCKNHYFEILQDALDLKNYTMTNRQWWQEAAHKTGINWTENIDGVTYSCGISKPYPTVRTNAPNQRTFWVELAPDAQNAQTRMVLAIDLILKN